MRVGREWWSLELRNGWHAEHDSECLTITRTREGGAFQLSAAYKEAGVIESAEVRDMAMQDEPLMGRLFSVIFNSFRRYSVAYSGPDGSFWRRYWLAKGSLLIFATYNGPPELRALEVPEVESMLRTLQAESGAA